MISSRFQSDFCRSSLSPNRGRMGCRMPRGCGHSYTQLPVLFSLAFPVANFSLTPVSTPGHSTDHLLPWARSQGGTAASRAGSPLGRVHATAPSEQGRPMGAGEAARAQAIAQGCGNKARTASRQKNQSTSQVHVQ